jgi:hypothetical protein
MFMSQVPGGMVLMFKSLILTANWTTGDILLLGPCGVTNVSVVCGKAKFAVVLNKLTFVFCVGAYDMLVRFTMVTPVIVETCAVVNGVNVGVVDEL